MQPNRQVLIWAGLGILALVGVVMTILITNRPQAPGRVAVNIPVAREQSPALEETAQENDAEDNEEPLPASPEAEDAADSEQVGEFITVDEENQTVTLAVIAAYDDSNGGLNFNGYANGDAAFVVPQGWTVEVQYSNDSTMPHSAGVFSTSETGQPQMSSEPVFEGAITDNFYNGTTEPDTFHFTPDEQGTYAIVCGVQGHAASGQWILLEVAESDTEPAFQTPDTEPEDNRANEQ